MAESMTQGKLIIVSNRLPIKIEIKKKQWQIKTSEGGLATGLGSFYREKGGIWIGWPGAQIKSESTEAEIKLTLRQQGLEPIFLTHAEINDYYEGFSNRTLWPLCHYFPSYASYSEKNWQAYQSVNKKFAEAVMKVAKPGDTIWIHDYQLMLVPQLIRQQLPDVSIGYFQHIPFPSYEVFRLIPWRNELLTGMLGADLIGFHTYDDVRHFISAILRILDVQSNMNVIEFEKRLITAEAFPMGIDYDKYFNHVKSTNTQKYSRKIIAQLEGKKLVISIDRLDYSKGIVQRLKGYECFLRNYPQYREKVIYYQLIVPSRDKVLEYDRLKQEIDKLVSHINAEYSSLSWQPIQYFYRAWSFDMLSALYNAADIALVTPLRDGMNLVCKEYIASKSLRPGVLILSEMAGAARELTEATIINPNDEQGLAEAIAEALRMPDTEQEQRIKIMQQTLKKFDIHIWVNNFLMHLNSIKQQQIKLSTRRINQDIMIIFRKMYQNANKRIFFLDYDGTLVPFQKDPQKAIPTEHLLSILKKLTEMPQNHLVIISGRQKNQLEKWMQGLHLDIIAEHGAWYREDNGEWEKNEDLSNYWKKDIRPVLEQFEIRTPGSFIEEKDFSLVWHYRKVESSLGELRAKEITAHLKYLVADKGLQVLEGHKVIEVKSALINKGKSVQKWLDRFPAEFHLAMGDDTTDEDTFMAMPKGAITIKVGQGMSRAAYYISTPEEALNLLAELIE
ncbi:trehalose 6-phosphate synthase/phosphatase [Arachidicoccus rhizosphaerae]|uniref:Alpha,alpha-trehalose-phosphate synthase n=1 Tax=Arachidicoccus rhizosphaerae TaxID=551991 RepID=A0A1H3YZ51_9BACT|nr:bifunctional alpha,alpha-trehalose-phosphate synthase (UDP-forming)/trehalose-phosphatase [Arachidicoccus rhizosphaerae]SEA16431.1 trehalose 6-phosphate synthase/phosphatase [Arachidicoccus rhizosphaerae]